MPDRRQLLDDWLVVLHPAIAVRDLQPNDNAAIGADGGFGGCTARSVAVAIYRDLALRAERSAL